MAQIKNTISANIPKGWPHRADCQRRVDEEYRGKVSPYILNLIERDLEMTPIGTAHEFISAEQWHRLMELDLLVCDCAQLALNFLQEADPEKRLAIAKELAGDILQNRVRDPEWPLRNESTGQPDKPVSVHSQAAKKLTEIDQGPNPPPHSSSEPGSAGGASGAPERRGRVPRRPKRGA